MKKWALLLVALAMAPFSEGVQIPSFPTVLQVTNKPTTKWSGGQWFLAHQPSTAVALSDCHCAGHNFNPLGRFGFPR